MILTVGLPNTMRNTNTPFCRLLLLALCLPPLLLAGCKSMEFAKVIDFPQPDADKEVTTVWFNLETLISLNDGGFMMGVNSPYWMTQGQSFGGENERMILMRFNKKGRLVWSKHYDCSLTSAGGSSRCLRQTPDGGFVIAANRKLPNGKRTARIIKTDGNGTPEWSRMIGDAKNYMLTNDIAFPPEGGYLLTGQVEDTRSICYLKLNEKGAMEWNKAYFAEGGGDEGLCTEPADGGGYVSFCRVTRALELDYPLAGDYPPPPCLGD